MSITNTDELHALLVERMKQYDLDSTLAPLFTSRSTLNAELNRLEGYSVCPFEYGLYLPVMNGFLGTVTTVAAFRQCLGQDDPTRTTAQEPTVQSR